VKRKGTWPSLKIQDNHVEIGKGARHARYDLKVVGRRHAFRGGGELGDASQEKTTDEVVGNRAGGLTHGRVNPDKATRIGPKK